MIHSHQSIFLCILKQQICISQKKTFNKSSFLQENKRLPLNSAHIKPVSMIALKVSFLSAIYSEGYNRQQVRLREGLVEYQSPKVFQSHNRSRRMKFIIFLVLVICLALSQGKPRPEPINGTGPSLGDNFFKIINV